VQSLTSSGGVLARRVDFVLSLPSGHLELRHTRPVHFHVGRRRPLPDRSVKIAIFPLRRPILLLLPVLQAAEVLRLPVADIAVHRIAHGRLPKRASARDALPRCANRRDARSRTEDAAEPAE
jgi:hypothetical protein